MAMGDLVELLICSMCGTIPFDEVYPEPVEGLRACLQVVRVAALKQWNNRPFFLLSIFYDHLTVYNNDFNLGE